MALNFILIKCFLEENLISIYVEKESATVVQGCSNYETLLEEQALMYILDHEANLDGQGSMKARNYTAEWKFKYHWVRTIDVLGQIRLKCIFVRNFE